MATLADLIPVIAGAVALVSGFVAVLTRKGGMLHRQAGAVFFRSILLMAVFAACLAVIVPGQTVNLFIAAFVSCLVWTAWVTARGREGLVGPAEKIALLVSLVLCAPFAVLSCQLALGLSPLFESAMPFKGPLLLAIDSFTFVLVMAAIGDARVVFGGGHPRLAAHRTALVAHAARADLGHRVGLHQRLRAAPARPPSRTGSLFPAPVPAARLALLLDVSRAAHGLALALTSPTDRRSSPTGRPWPPCPGSRSFPQHAGTRPAPTRGKADR